MLRSSEPTLAGTIAGARGTDTAHAAGAAATAGCCSSVRQRSPDVPPAARPSEALCRLLSRETGAGPPFPFLDGSADTGLPGPVPAPSPRAPSPRARREAAAAQTAAAVA